MSTPRTKDSYQKRLYEFRQEVHVVCPSCQGHAIVRNPTPLHEHNIENLIRVICENCGYNKRLDEKQNLVLLSSPYKKLMGKLQIFGAPIDPNFHLPVWLTTNCCNNTLWAYNYEHLEFLRAHVDAKLRERNLDDMQNRSLGSRLPRWMTSKKNREAVLKAIEQLKNKK